MCRDVREMLGLVLLPTTFEYLGRRSGGVVINVHLTVMVVSLGIKVLGVFSVSYIFLRIANDEDID